MPPPEPKVLRKGGRFGFQQSTWIKLGRIETKLFTTQNVPNIMSFITGFQLFKILTRYLQ